MIGIEDYEDLENTDVAICPVCEKMKEKAHMVEIDGQFYCRKCLGDED